ncbi:MAG TPA: hypothetical protein EYG73_06160 [Arcobacter sp.]|nr:hypothetical protein [Arcobacter sp.]
MKKLLLLGSLLATLLFTGCGEVQPGLSDAVKGSFKVNNGMTMDEVSKVMVIEPTGQEKIGDYVIWRYEGNTYTGEDETLIVKFNNIIIKFKKGIVTHSGTFSCNLPKVQED